MRPPDLVENPADRAQDGDGGPAEENMDDGKQSMPAQAEAEDPDGKAAKQLDWDLAQLADLRKRRRRRV